MPGIVVAQLLRSQAGATRPEICFGNSFGRFFSFPSEISGFPGGWRHRIGTKSFSEMVNFMKSRLKVLPSIFQGNLRDFLVPGLVS